MLARRKLTTLALAAATTMAIIGVAAAADVTRPVFAPTAAGIDWSGFYLGFNGGGGFGQEDCESCSTGANDFSISGLFAGGQAGFNWQTGMMVLGIEGDIQLSSVHGLCNGSSECSGPPQLTVQDLDWFGTVRGRLGWLTGGDWMPYVTGGLAFGHGTRNTSSGGGDTATATHTGWVAGIGVERMLPMNWSAKIEYQYIDFGSANYVFPNIGGPDPDVSLTLHTLRFGLNKHF